MLIKGVSKLNEDIISKKSKKIKENKILPINHNVEQSMLDGSNKDKFQVKSETKEELNQWVDDGYIFSEKKVFECIDHSELGDMQLFVELFRDKYVYSHLEKQWFFYNKHNWVEDENGEILTEIEHVINIYENEMNRQRDKSEEIDKNDTLEIQKERKKYYKARIKLLKKRVSALSKKKRIDNVISLSSNGKNSLSLPLNKEWDENKDLIAFDNCVFSLNTRLIVESNPRDYIRKKFQTSYDRKAKAPLYKKSMIETLGSLEIFEFRMRVFGYSLTRNPIEHKSFIDYGPYSRSGKTNMMEINKALMGEYAAKISASYFMKKKHGDNSDGPDVNLMHIMNRMYVWVSETEETDRLNLAKIKEMTGGDTISGRGMYHKKNTEFKPQFVLTMITNMKPNISSNDDGFWERNTLQTFAFKFVHDPKEPWEKKRDSRLYEKIVESELPGIFNLYVEGLYDYYERVSLDTPQDLVDDTERYREEEDRIGNFIKERCIVDNEKRSVSSTDLYKCYKDYCEEHLINPIAQRSFSTDILKRKFKRVQGRNFNYFEGITIKSEYSY